MMHQHAESSTRCGSAVFLSRALSDLSSVLVRFAAQAHGEELRGRHATGARETVRRGGDAHSVFQPGLRFTIRNGVIVISRIGSRHADVVIGPN